MSTVESKRLILDAMKNGGTLFGDPVYTSIWKYTTQARTETYAIFTTTEHDMFISPHVAEPVLLMAKGMLTEEGKKFLNDNSN